MRGALIPVAAAEDKKLLPEFSSMILKLLCLRFWYFIHFEIMFVFGVAVWSTFILMQVAVQFFSDPFIDDTFFH